MTASKPSSIAGGKPAALTALIALHSFTPTFKGVARPWHAAVLYHRDPRFPRRLLALLKEEKGLIVGDNEPYSVSDETDYTIPVHGERRGLPHALVEIRQDLIADDNGQRAWAELLGAPFAAGIRGSGHQLANWARLGAAMHFHFERRHR